MKIEIQEGRDKGCKTRNLIDGDYVVAFNVKTSYAEEIVRCFNLVNKIQKDVDKD